MTPKEKAIELVDKFREYSHTDFNYYSGVDTEIKNAKQCALIAVDLLISETFLDFYVNHPQPYWQEVKTELEKL
jgi:hypothetical protein